MTMLEKANAAAMDEVKRQLGLTPIPGDIGGGWAGRGDPGSLDFAPIVRAALAAMRPTDTTKFTQGEWRAINDWLDDILDG